MCLILVAWRCHPVHKLLVAANRDEFYHRPAAPVHYWDDAPHILAGRDLEQGGSWLGITTTGRFAALTNIRNPSAPPGSRSRGFLVRDYLAGNHSPAGFHARLQTSLHDYSPFNLLLGDGEELHYCNSHGDWRSLPPGIYGLSNGVLDTPWPKVVNGKQQLLSLLTGELDVAALFSLLADRQPAPEDELPDTGIDRELEKRLSSRFIHFEGYGTRCSTVLLQSHTGSTALHERLFNAGGECEQTRQLIWPE